MPTSLFISLPVQDVTKSTALYEAIGFQRNPQFTGDATSCLVVSDTISLMLASHEQFQQISPRPMADPTKGCQVLLSLSLESREAVDDMVAKAIAAGGSKAHEPEDYGFMYQHAFYDLDGHGWGLTWFNPNAAQVS
ncbi:VOC family protein [Planctomyces sp. SH-PL14]|uniref:VOC family protein n=1 Tax=Planctomyces sp. SH-PL14 TaxID=1632864 RepID=UPI00078CCB1E|nr:VOC family protein [Planctomyces sp. SH-PL14]AMV19100.1 Glyoxalase-like domain protein [Planctomyces sp. SH-PL14]